MALIRASCWSAALVGAASCLGYTVAQGIPRRAVFETGAEQITIVSGGASDPWMPVKRVDIS